MSQKSFLIAGNWKMNGSRQFTQDFIQTFSSQLPLSFNQTALLLPPLVYLAQAQQLLGASPVHLGAQTVSEYADGAYTGEVSAAMLKDLSCSYGLVGHSERRSLFGETNQVVARKFAALQSQGITPILCVGETLAEREAGQAFAVIQQQIAAVWQLNGEQSFCNAVIAYEPVWAIGTGKTASPEQAQEIHGKISEYVAQLQPKLTKKVQILYGGSLKPENAAALFAMPDIDGGLIGGASLNVEQFLLICDIAQKVSNACNP